MSNMNQQQANAEVQRLSRAMIELRQNSIPVKEAEELITETVTNACNSVLHACIEITRAAESTTDAIKQMKEMFNDLDAEE